MSDRSGAVLLTGATGYVGGRLLPRLESRGISLRCLTRRPVTLAARVAPGTEVVPGDIRDPEALRRALHQVETAYYLAHSMGDAGDFQENEREAARAFATIAREAGVARIVYLGGLAHGEALSPHLATRQEVGRILRLSGAQVVEFRASIIIGSGSLSFEMVRSLVEGLPIMVTPRWVSTLAQPIAIDDVLSYLLAALDLPTTESTIYEIGGVDRTSYRGLMEEYARQRGLHRVFLPVPFLTPRLSSLWLGIVTPLYARVGRKLIDGLRHDTVTRDDRALHDFSVVPVGIQDAIRRALSNEDREFAETRWNDAVSAVGEAERRWGGARFGARIVDSRALLVAADPAPAFRPVRRIGGSEGWYYGTLLWRLRGALDKLVGGPGLRRGRRDQETPRVGDALDFWRVEAYEPDRLLRLRAEMRIPGRAWLQFESQADPSGGTQLRQTAIFDPLGLGGLLYWYVLYPVHVLIFDGMLRRIKDLGERGA